jgi:DNA-binding CsgD family transcriptional regulator
MTAPEPAYVRHEDALESDLPLARLKAHALSAVGAVVPVTMAWCFEVDRRQQPVQALVVRSGPCELEPGRPPGPTAHDPFAAGRVQARGATVLALKDLPPAGTESLRRRLAQAQIADRADVYLRDAGTIVAQLALVRSFELGVFSRQDLTALRRLQPLLEHAFACAVAPQATSAHDALVRSGLSPREAEVAEMVGRGSTNAEIARSLHIGEATVKTHLTHVYTKLGVRTRTQLALLLGRTTSG